MTKTPPKRWIICGLLFLGTIVNYLDRQTISVSASRIAAEMHLNDFNLGELFFGFLFAYGIAQILVGPILDRFRTVPAYAVAVIAWSLAGASTALAPTFGFLLAARIALRLCESPNWPLGLRVVARTFPASQRSLANGIFESGTSIGSLIAPPIVIYLAVTYGWRASFVVIGGVGFVWVAIWLLWFRKNPEPALDIPETPLEAGQPANKAGSFAEILRSRVFWGLVVATSFLNPLQYFYTTWLPRYFDKYAGLGFGTQLAQHLVVVYFALDIGLWTGGALVAYLSPRMGVRRARILVTAVGTCCMMTVPFVSVIRNLDAITAVICVATFGVGWFMVNYLSFTSEVSTTRISTAAGLLGGIGSLAGAGFMLLVGGSIEKSGSFSIAFLMAGAMPVIAFVGIWISTRPAAIPPAVALAPTP
ncbi:MAG TPA: MFS transporter [Opitutaceae bacterium]|jgi:ACS family hexuronate transporter-like MFS transporter|nr:MFS transporter [Opitutaceae bacterium]